jgi:hypothetical protein
LLLVTSWTPCFIGLGLLAYFTSLFTDMYGSLIHTIFVVDFPRWRRFLTRWFCDRIHSVTCKNLYMTYFPVNIIVYECFWRRLRLIMTLYQRILICCLHFLLLEKCSRLDIRVCALSLNWIVFSSSCKVDNTSFSDLDLWLWIHKACLLHA